MTGSELPLKMLMVCADVDAGTAVGRASAELVAELEALGMLVTLAASARDAEAVVASARTGMRFRTTAQPPARRRCWA